MSNPYKKQVFLVTRPAHQARNLCTQIEKLGGRCLLFPTISIRTCPSEQIANAVHSLTPTDKAIFTSANAVYPVMPYWEKIKPISTFAIGSGTAKALSNFQIMPIVPTEFNSEGLLALPALQQVQQERIVIFAGAGGRDLLREGLTKRGAMVHKIAVYQRECPMMAAPFPPTESIDWIISTSAESLRNLWKMAGMRGQGWLQDQRLLVISKKMQVLAQQLGFKQIPACADSASDADILRALIFYCDS